MFPMLGGEVVEGEQRLAVFAQALDSLLILDAIAFGEAIECSLGSLPGLRHPDVLQRTLGFCLQESGWPLPSSQPPTALPTTRYSRPALASLRRNSKNVSSTRGASPASIGRPTQFSAFPPLRIQSKFGRARQSQMLCYSSNNSSGQFDVLQGKDCAIPATPYQGILTQ